MSVYRNSVGIYKRTKVTTGGDREKLLSRREKQRKRLEPMLFGGNGDPREFMRYNGKTYLNGTQFTVKDEYINSHTFNGKKIWKYAKFWGTTNGPSGLCYYFSRDKYSFCDLLNMGYKAPEERNACQRDYAPFFTVMAWQLSNVIEEITHPITLSDDQEEAINQAIMDMIEHPKTDWDYPELVIGWIVYIAAMVGSLIFNEFYIPWVIATYVFYQYRKGVLGQ